MVLVALTFGKGDNREINKSFFVRVLLFLLLLGYHFQVQIFQNRLQCNSPYFISATALAKIVMKLPF